MDSDNYDQRLSRISTQWSIVFQAHAGGLETVTSAQKLLLQRYSGAVFRYLLGAVRDPDAAEELSQEFALRFVRGDFHRADPGRGRFRDYVKTALLNLVRDYQESRQAWPRQLPADCPEPAAPPPHGDASEPDFLQSWRAELLERTWKTLAEDYPEYHAVLLFRVENPDVPSAQAAVQLAERFGKPLTAAAVRKAAQRSRERFADLLLNEVAHALEVVTPGKLEEELRELDLLKYCRSGLERRGRSH